LKGSVSFCLPFLIPLCWFASGPFSTEPLFFFNVVLFLLESLSFRDALGSLFFFCRGGMLGLATTWTNEWTTSPLEGKLPAHVFLFSCNLPPSFWVYLLSRCPVFHCPQLPVSSFNCCIPFPHAHEYLLSLGTPPNQRFLEKPPNLGSHPQFSKQYFLLRIFFNYCFSCPSPLSFRTLLRV